MSVLARVFRRFDKGLAVNLMALTAFLSSVQVGDPIGKVELIGRYQTPWKTPYDFIDCGLNVVELAPFCAIEDRGFPSCDSHKSCKKLVLSN